MARTAQQQANVDQVLDEFPLADDAEVLTSRAAFWALDSFGLDATAETFEVLTIGASFLTWWVEHLKREHKISEQEKAKLLGIVQMGASVWAANAVLYRSFAEMQEASGE